jgi:hypothetical protein
MVVQIEGPTEYTMAFPAYADQGRTSGFDVVKAKRKIKATLPVIDRILRLLDVIAKVANLSQPERRQAIDASKGRDLREAERRFVNTEAFTAPGMYDEGMTKAVRGPTGERTGTELEQGIRPLPQDIGSEADVARTARYRNIPDFGAFAEGSLPDTQQSSVSTRGTERPALAEPAPGRTPQGSVSSSMEARQAQRPGFYESGRGKGGCHSCDEMEGGASMTYEQLPRANQMEFNTILNREKLEHEERTRRRISPADLEAMKERILQRIITRRNLQIPTGAGVGDGPVNQDMAKSTFYERMGRYPNSDEELMEFMKSMNEKAQLPVDEGFAPKGGRRRKPMTARDKRLAGRGKPRETEASRLLKELDEADDDQLTGGSKKKNTSRHYV